MKGIIRLFLIFALIIFLSFQIPLNSETKNQLNRGRIQNYSEIERVPTGLRITADYGNIPLYFIPNEGQVNERVLFYAKTPRYTLWLTKQGLVFDSSGRRQKIERESQNIPHRRRIRQKDYAHEQDVSKLTFLDARENTEIVPVGHTDHRVNYFIGNERSKWRTNIQTSHAVLYREIYRNIDLKVYGRESQIEYDFVVNPGGEVSDISFTYKNINSTRIDEEGNLVIRTAFGELVHSRPICYQIIAGQKSEGEARFKHIADDCYGFDVKDYDRDSVLIVDPVLEYSTYLGGSERDRTYGIAVDKEGAAYVTGETWSSDFPVLNPIKGSYEEGYSDAFITKINPAGTGLVYSTIIGGTWWDDSYDIAVDPDGAVYVTGSTDGMDFPVTIPYAWGCLFVTKIDPSGSRLIYSRVLETEDYPHGVWIENISISIDRNGSAVVAGDYDLDRPGPPIHQVFIIKLNPAGDTETYHYEDCISSGECHDIAIDRKGAAFVIGFSFYGKRDAFIMKLNPEGDSVDFTRYFGGSDREYGESIALDREGAIYVTGTTYSDDFPTRNPFQSQKKGEMDAFVAKINPKATAIIYSSFLGGSDEDRAVKIALDEEGAAYVTGYTYSSDFPVKNSLQKSLAGKSDVFATKIDPEGRNIVCSTYLGGSDWDIPGSIAVEKKNKAYLTGYTLSLDFPTLKPLQRLHGGDRDAFITKIIPYYVLTLTTQEGGTTDPEPGIYRYSTKTETSITAIPESGYRFSNWSGDVLGTENPLTITMNADKSIEAHFVRVYALILQSSLGGRAALKI